MSDWKEYRLEDALECLIDYRGKTPEKTSFGVPLITAKIVKKGKIETPTEFIAKENYNSWMVRGLPKVGDVVLTTEAPLGEVAQLEDDNVALAQRIVTLRSKKDLLDNDFLLYLLQSDFVQHQLEARSSGSTVKGIKQSELRKIILKFPSLDEQQRIALQLKVLDQKIQLNTQINQTLEQIAQAIFKSWFVDFDPVRAKADSLAQGKTQAEAELAAQQIISGKTLEELTALCQTHPDRYAELEKIARAFPSEFEEVEGFGGVPRGWEILPLPEIIDFLEGPGIRNWQYTDAEDGIKFINIRCIQSGDLTLDTANKITKEEAFGKYKHFQLEENDIVVSTSGTLGRFAFVRKEHLPLSLNTSVIRFRPIENKSTLAFITGFVENQLQHELEIRASGSAQRNFGPTHLKQISLLVSDFKLLELHQKYISSFFEKRKLLLSEVDILKCTRDLLLPKLLDGDLI